MAQAKRNTGIMQAKAPKAAVVAPVALVADKGAPVAPVADNGADTATLTFAVATAYLLAMGFTKAPGTQAGRAYYLVPGGAVGAPVVYLNNERGQAPVKVYGASKVKGNGDTNGAGQTNGAKVWVTVGGFKAVTGALLAGGTTAAIAELWRVATGYADKTGVASKACHVPADVTARWAAAKAAPKA
jgi:hypothetical protein